MRVEVMPRAAIGTALQQRLITGHEIWCLGSERRREN
jgi:hypothetical protein